MGYIVIALLYFSMNSDPKTKVSAFDQANTKEVCYGPKLVVFSGGTAFNSVFPELSNLLTTQVSHIIPVSDNGGSTR